MRAFNIKTILIIMLPVILFLAVSIVNSSENKLNLGLNNFKSTVSQYGLDYNDVEVDCKINPKGKCESCVYLIMPGSKCNCGCFEEEDYEGCWYSDCCCCVA